MFDGYFRYKSCRDYFVYSAVPDNINMEEALVQYIHQGLLLKCPSKFYTFKFSALSSRFRISQTFVGHYDMSRCTQSIEGHAYYPGRRLPNLTSSYVGMFLGFGLLFARHFSL
jgi:hypothetical protein